jgi:hypothetical protein
MEPGGARPTPRIVVLRQTGVAGGVGGEGARPATEVAVNARFAVVCCAVLSLAGCGGEHLLKPVTLTLVSPVVLAQVRSAPDSVTVAGVGLRLSTYLWRDFMPVAPPDGQPLAAALFITTADSSEFPAELSADAAWVLNGSGVWATWVSETFPRAPDYPTLRVFADGGPKWGPGIEVDVVVRLRAAAGAAWYLRARRQVIQRTD